MSWRSSSVAVAAALVAAAVALADPGDRDPTYGTSGSVLYGQVNTTRFHDVAVHPLGGVVAAGRATYTTAGGGLSPLLVTRHGEDGAIDTSWGNQPTTLQDGADRRGSFRMVGNSSTEAHAVAIDGQNRILVAAETTSDANPGGDLVILRLTATGQLDTSYNGDGFSDVLGIDTDITIVGMALAPDGKVAVAVNHDVSGSATSRLFQFTAGGDPDTSFGGGDGEFTVGGDTEVSDLLVDLAGRITYARATLGGDPQEPTRIFQVRRLTATGNPDPEFNSTGSLALPSAINAHPIKLASAPGGVTFAGSASPASGGVNFRAVQIFTDGTLYQDYGGTGSGGVGTGFLPGYSAPVPRGIAVLSDGKVVIAARISAPDGAPRIGLVRLRDSGTTDSSFRPSAPDDIRFAAVDQLGLSATTLVDPVGGIVRVTDDKVVVAGLTDSETGATSDFGFLARYGAPGDPPVVSLTRSYRPIGDPPVVRDFSRPGQPVDFTATATDAEGPIASYEWSVDGGAFQPGEATFSRAFDAGEHTVTVRVRDGDGQDATASATAVAIENQGPVSDFGAAHDTYNPTSVPSTLEEDRFIIFKSLATDADGEIKRVEWDLDGVSGFEASGTHRVIKYPTPGKRTIAMRAIDNEGKSSFKQIEINVINPPCQSSRTVTIGRLRAFAPCWNKKVEGNVTTWTAKAPPPPPPPPPAGTFMVNDPIIAELNGLPNVIFAPVSINGIFFTDYDVVQIVMKTGQDPKISYSGAKVITPSIYGTPLTLSDGGGDTWTFDRDANRIEGVSLARGRYGSLDVGALSEPIALPALGKARLRFYPLLPPALGSVTSDDAVTLNVGGAPASAAQVAKAAQSGGLDCFKASSATIKGLEFAPGDVKICRDANDPELWKLKIDVDLSQFGASPFKLPKISVDVAMRRDFVSIFGNADFSDPGLPLITPIFLTGIDFQVVLNPKKGDIAAGKDGHKPKCVPGWDTEDVDNQAIRDILIDKGVPASAVNLTIPDFHIDYGIPTTTACGGLSFAAQLGSTGLADGHISLGFADYPDRVDAFRAIGNARLLGNDDYRANVEFAVYSNGYADMEAKINLVFFDLVEVDGGVIVQVLPAEGKFNAEAWVKGCIIPLDFCSSIKALISNKGVGGCLGLTFLGAEWEPGATYKYTDGLTLYFSGCDLDDIRQEFDGKGSTTITTVLPAAARSASTAFSPGLPPRARITQTAKPEQKLEVAAGLPGIYFAVRGQDNQLARFTLTGPKGERISVDGRADGKAMEGRNLIVGHDATTGVSHVLIGTPSAGTWTLTPDQGSPPIINVWSSEGLDKPKVTGKVTGSGRQRELSYRLTPRSGQVVRFEERGRSGKQHLGAAGAASGRLRFKSAAGKAEQRDIVAVIEQDGMLRDEQVVTTYRAPGTGRPSKVGRALIRRSGTKVTLRWLPARDAESYLVTGRLANGRTLRLALRKRTTTVKRVPKTVGGTFKIVAINELGVAGKATTVKLKKPRKARKRGR